MFDENNIGGPITSMTKYSFIVPAYNVEENLIRRCVDSIVNQTYPEKDYELILVDDGSKPEFAKLYDELQNDMVRVVHKENGGVTTARNRGIREAKGEWTFFVDGDDYVSSEILASVSDLLQQNTDTQLDMIFFNIHRKKIGSEFKQKCLDKNDGDFLTEQEVHGLLLDNIAQGYKESTIPFGRIEICSKAYRTEFLIKNSLFFHEDMKIAEDLVFNAECLVHSPRSAYLDRYLIICQEREGSAVKKYYPDIKTNDKRYIDYLNNIGKSIDQNEFKNALNKRLIFCSLGVITYDMAHPDNPKSFSERLSDIKSFVRSEPYKTAIKDCKVSWIQPKKNKFKLLLLRFKFEWLYLKMINKL